MPQKDLHAWCKEAAGDDYEIKWIQRFKNKNLTSVEPGYKWWDAFSGVMDGLNVKLIKTIFPGDQQLEIFIKLIKRKLQFLFLATFS